MSASERPVHTLLNWPSMVATYGAQLRHLSRSHVDVVIANGILGAHLVGLAPGPWRRVAVIHHLYHDAWATGACTPPGGVSAAGERFLLHRLRADAVAVVNPAVAERLARPGISFDRVVVVGNGVDPTEYSFAARHDEETLVFVGRLRKDKGVDTVLDAFAIIQRYRPQSVLHIVGDGLLRQSLERRAHDLGVGSSVVFHGFIDERSKIGLLQRATIYLSASRFEGFGLPLVEAMATGTVPIVSDIPAHRYIFQEREVGCLVSSADRMAARALELFQDPVRRSVMAHRGRELVEEMWTWERVAGRYRGLIDDLLSPPVQGACGERGGGGRGGY
jgi:glycosyltransferase involved in cell wall biosynthesis